MSSDNDVNYRVLKVLEGLRNDVHALDRKVTELATHRSHDAEARIAAQREREDLRERVNKRSEIVDDRLNAAEKRATERFDAAEKRVNELEIWRAQITGKTAMLAGLVTALATVGGAIGSILGALGK